MHRHACSSGAGPKSGIGSHSSIASRQVTTAATPGSPRARSASMLTNARVRVRAAQHRGMEHARYRKVIDVVAAAEQELPILDLRDRLADPAVRCIHGHRHSCAPALTRHHVVRRGLEPRSGVEERVDDELVAGTAAQVARDRLARLGPCRARGSHAGTRSREAASPACSTRIAGRGSPGTPPGAGSAVRAEQGPRRS